MRRCKAGWGLRNLGYLLAVFIVFTASEAVAATYYVNAGCGNDSWSGTSAACAATNGPKKTIQAGIGAAIGGDTVLVADGTYVERINFNG